MKTQDDFNWANYTKENYLPQIEDMEKKGIEFVLDKTKVNKGKIKWKENVHENAKILYSEVVKLKINSVFECGCAGGHHLANIKKLIPGVEFAGYEISINQIEKASKKLGISKNITEKLYAFDITDTLPQHGKYEYVYTNAVIMHMSYERAVKAVQNMDSLSSKYIRLIEDKAQHDFKKLFKDAGVDKYTIKKDGIGYLITK